MKRADIKNLLQGDQRFAKFVWGKPSTIKDDKGKEIETLELYALKGNRDNVAPMSGGVVTEARDEFDQMGKPCVSMQMNGAGAKIWEELIRLGYEHGFRNSQATLLAPTGTIGFMMDCDTTGVEPDFALIKKKKLAGGGVMLIPSQSLKPGLKNLGYDPQKITEIMANLEKTGKLNVRGEHCEIFHCAHEISPLDHLRMMAAVQPLISGGISKTVNLSNGATIEEIEELYVEAWRMGLKSVAIYRDGSKRIRETPADSEKAT